MPTVLLISDGMTTLKMMTEPIARTLRVERKSGRRHLTVVLRDGQYHSVPLAFYPTLAGATPAQLRNYRLIGPGVGFHWPTLDFDLSVRGVLEGRREVRNFAMSRRRAG